MKNLRRHNIIVALTALFISMATLVFAENVTVQTAQRVAQSFLNSKVEGVPQIHLIDFAEKASFPNFYVFGNERCFVIIAGDDAVHPVLGYSTNGGFGNEEMCNEVRDWLKSYDDQIALVKTDRLAATEEILSKWNDLINGRGLEPKSRTVVSPLIRTKWSHKRVPFNNLCPEAPKGPGGHCVGGCGSVAMAQFLKYWEHPIRGIGEHSYTPHAHPEFGVQYANFGETVYDWDNMLNDYFHGYSDAEASAVATLLYHCGVSVDINYGDTASGTNPSDVDTALWTYFNYTHNSHYLRKINYTDAQWIAMLKSDLDLEHPVIYRGKNQQTDVGHIFICDGYDEYDYFHFVLGWGGNYDGYYAIGAIHPSYDMNYLNGAVFGSYPNTPSIAPPNNISTSVSGQNVIINWSPVSGASHYRLYRDGDLVAAHLNNSSYTDHNVNYGTHFYYVKSVKNDGTMSLKSSKAFAEIHFSGPIPTNMVANTNGHDVSLSWQTPNTESSILHYGLDEPSTSGAGANTQGDRTYWAQRYSVSVLMANAGMTIEKVSFYSRRAGEYTVGIYKGNVASITEFVYQQNYTATAGSWQDIVFTQPVPIDYTQDLWVVFYSDVYKPASYCSYSGVNVSDASLYSQSGVSSWSRLNNRSWLIKTYLTDGTYTYNLYRNGNAVATNLTDNTYTDSNLPDGIYDYQVTTNYFGGESDPSNVVSVQIGTPVTQTISFTSGWNWWSTYIEQEGIEGLGMLQDGLDGNGISIRSQADGYIVYYAGYGWYGSLSGINNESSYKIKTDAPCSVAMTGMGAVPSQHPITLSHGWTWMGYVPSTAMDVNEALSGMNAIQGDMLKSQQGYADYYPNYGWYGSLNTIEPGMGLMYYSSSNQPKTLVYPEGGRGVEQKANHTADNNHWVPDMHAYPHNMTVTAIIELDGEELRAENYELAAFAADECRGSVRLMYVEPIDRWMAFLTITGEDAANLNFSLYDMETGMEYSGSEETLNYETDAMVGTMGEPYIVRFRSAASEDENFSYVSIFPNPANDILNIRGEGIHSVTVFNMTGQSVDKVEADAVETLILDVNDYVAGVYLLLVQSKYASLRKLFVKK